MNITARLDMLINDALANGQNDTFNALRLLRDDAARLEADAARLDWLEGSVKRIYFRPHEIDGVTLDFGGTKYAHGDTLRAAIDAAKGDA